MTTKLNKLIGFIKENSKDGEARLYPSELSELGLNELEIDKLIDDLSKTKAVLNKRIAFAPNRIQSTYPKQADFSSVQNDTYNVPVFLLHIDEGRVQEILNRNRKSDSVKGILPSFNVLKGDVIIDGVSYHIADTGDYQHYICKILLETEPDKRYKIGDWISEGYLEDNYAPVGTVFRVTHGTETAFKSERWVKDAVYKINEKVRKQFGIDKFIDYRKANIRIVTENFK